MPESTFLPYEFARSALQICISSLTVDGVDHKLDGVIDVEHRVVNLSGIDEWNTSVLGVGVTDPSQQIENVVHEKESAENTVKMFAVMKDRRTRYRTGKPLMFSDTGNWEAQVEVHREQHDGKITLQALAVRSLDHEQATGKASFSSERIADSDIWTLYVAEKVPVPGSSIDNEWRDFAKDSNPELVRRGDNIWFLDLEIPDKPRLYLNEGVKGLRQALENIARKGRAASARETLTGSILQPVLCMLATSAINEAESENVDDLGEWQRKMLIAMAASADDATEEMTVEKWLRDWRNRRSEKALNDLQMAVQRHLSVNASTERLIKSFGGQNNEQD